jgi:hypothetical protein
VKTLKTEVGKGFSRTVIVRELVDPKLQCNIVKTDYTRRGVAPSGAVSRRIPFSLNDERESGKYSRTVGE